MSFEFFEEKGGGLTTACVAGLLGTEEDEVIVRTWAGGETRWERSRYR